jgi:hypothetical protein
MTKKKESPKLAPKKAALVVKVAVKAKKKK